MRAEDEVWKGRGRAMPRWAMRVGVGVPAMAVRREPTPTAGVAPVKAPTLAVWTASVDTSMSRLRAAMIINNRVVSNR